MNIPFPRSLSPVSPRIADFPRCMGGCGKAKGPQEYKEKIPGANRP